MPLVQKSACPHCGSPTQPRDLGCGKCGQMLGLRRPGRDSTAGRAPSPPVRSARKVARLATGTPRDAGRSGGFELQTGYLYLGVGAGLALVFLLPFPNWVGWYFAALVHEMGHAAVAWSLGCPAIPALGIGEAMTIESPQSSLLAVGLWGAAMALAWQRTAGRTRWVALATVSVAYPALAFTSLGTLAKLVAGHGAELAFAGLAVWRALTGGFTSSNAERALYACLGWFLIARNVHLTLGLVSSAEARAHYATCGSFGCTNDYIRVADGWLGGSLEGVALIATLPALSVLPVVILLHRIAKRS